MSNLKSKRTKLRHHISNFKLHCMAIVTKIVWQQYVNRHIDQWKEKREPEINPHTYNQLITDRVPRTHNKKVSLINHTGKTDIHMQKRIKLDSYYILLRKINSKWVRLKILRPETTNFQKKTQGECLDLVFGVIFMFDTKAKAIIDRWDYIKL